ncbi:OLC1v1002898C2 [Oldenlandia corymbosa var. corymbosa]|uniref:OLC1v1002898C2 n=1 Tax=Oldenlandia corymbosa var. corymbosa TaxID=529605 RepID=A0AAV1DBP3_OLDCO|nr:OLC1v1002898C2 [Oldenlandia corymbosa var. corymbosa]
MSNVADCELPNELIVSNILSRLPVKSILRFRCVSKSWRSLFSTPQFITMHLKKTSNNSLNHCFIIHSLDKVYSHNMSVLNINSMEKEPFPVVNPFPVFLLEMDLVGSINGLVCLSWPPRGQMIVLWNPAINLWKGIKLSDFRFQMLGKEPVQVSVGLGYDEARDDYKIVRICSFKGLDSWGSCAEVYSVKQDSWKIVRLSFQCMEGQTRPNVIAKGIPYWAGLIGDESDESELKAALLWFDAKNDVFRHFPAPRLLGNDHSEFKARLVEWQGCVASLLYSPTKEKLDCLDVVVYDEIKGCWERRFSFGPIGSKIYSLLQCSKDGVVLAETPEGTLFLYDPATNGIKGYCISGALKESFEAFSYIESLVCVEGMELVKAQDKNKFCISLDELNIN